MLTAHETYKESHAALFSAKSQEEIQNLSRKTVENYLENRRIWDELNHYKTHGEILGKHRIFARMRRSEEIRKMKVGELVTLKIRLENNLVRNKANVKRQPTHAENGNRMERIEEMTRELNEVNRLLHL